MAQTKNTKQAGRDGAAARDSAPDAYSWLQIALHWSIATLVLVQLVANDAIRIAFRARLDDRIGLGEQGSAANVHIVLGLLVLVLTLMRLVVRLVRGAPPPAPGIPPVLQLVGKLAHWALYALLFAMPLTGAIAWFGATESAAILHEIGRFLLIALVTGHGFAALFEHFAMRNITLMRMLGRAER